MFCVELVVFTLISVVMFEAFEVNLMLGSVVVTCNVSCIDGTDFVISCSVVGFVVDGLVIVVVDNVVVGEIFGVVVCLFSPQLPTDRLLDRTCSHLFSLVLT